MTSLELVPREALINSHGVRYSDFRATLLPKYSRLWLELLSGHLALLLLAGGLVIADRFISRFWLVTGLTGGVLMGYAVAYLLLFFHEAAHYNLARNRRLNDWLANLLIGSVVGQNIKNYRPIHFNHHRYLGTPDDPEHSYFNALSIRFLLETLTGIRPIKVMLSYREVTVKKQLSSRNQLWPLILGMGLNGMIVICAWLSGCLALALAWASSSLIFFPFFSGLRQLLEHRCEKADRETDSSRISHEAVTRMFQSGLIGSTLGGAGFSRHLLHHWDPQVSCTLLAELEAFLSDTQAGECLRMSKTTYFRTFIRLFKN